MLCCRFQCSFQWCALCNILILASHKICIKTNDGAQILQTCIRIAFRASCRFFPSFTYKGKLYHKMESFDSLCKKEIPRETFMSKAPNNAFETCLKH